MPVGLLRKRIRRSWSSHGSRERRLKQCLHMTPTFCSRCGDAVEEGCNPWDELAELDALLERLRVKRYDLKRKINRVQSLIVRQLPRDVMSTIFEFCLPDFTVHQPSPYIQDDISIPLSLGAICSYWRDVAWSTPSLWCSLVICVTRNHDPHIVTCIAQEWLSRSGQLPLSIRICSKLYEHETFSALADIINQYSPRWSNLDLYIPDTYYKYFHGTDNHAPILKSIRFSCSFYRKMMNLQLTCPRLERATLSHILINRTNITNFQWDNLTHLTLYSMFTLESLLILHKTPRLVFLKISGGCPLYREEPIIGTIVLTSLKSLQLMMLVGGLLNNLIAPNLEEFSLRQYSISAIEIVGSFLRRSACSLRSFFIIISNFPPYFEDFMGLLQSMPSLNTLSIMSTMYTNSGDVDYDPRNILQLAAKVLLSQSSSFQQRFLPNLKILEYTGKLGIRPGKYDDLHSLLPTDNALHGPLNLLKINVTQHRLPKNMISYLSMFVERGVTVNVMSKSEDILQSSIDYFRRREDLSCRDWADNLDSTLFS